MVDRLSLAEHIGEIFLRIQSWKRQNQPGLSLCPSPIARKAVCAIRPAQSQHSGVEAWRAALEMVIAFRQ